MSDITEGLAALRSLKTTELAERYRELWGKEPHVRHREWLWKRCAWKLQECRHGGLSVVAQRRLEELIAEIDLPQAEQMRTISGKLRKKGAPKAKTGTVLTRMWRGREVRATAVEGGWEHEGTTYPTLTALVRAVTGSKWNPSIFFGLTDRGRRK